MLCAKFGWNWPSGSGKEDENVKSLQMDGLTDWQTDGPTDDRQQVIGKAHLSFQLRWAKNHINLTLLSKVNVVSESWMCTTLHIIMIHPCSKYGMPMSNQEKVRSGHESAQIHRQTVQTKWFLYTPLNFVYRGYKNITISITFFPNILIRAFFFFFYTNFIVSHLQMCLTTYR